MAQARTFIPVSAERIAGWTSAVRPNGQSTPRKERSVRTIGPFVVIATVCSE
jgi:hypothetical protein